MEKCYPDNFANTYALPDRAYQQLKYRYEREYSRGIKPPISKILEKDTFASRKIILCVCKIIDYGSDPFLEIHDDDNPFKPAEVLLTDGWYTLPAVFDEVLTKCLAKAQIVIGQKLTLCGSKLNSMEPVTALENVSTKLVVSANGTIRTHWAAKLGFRKSFL